MKNKFLFFDIRRNFILNILIILQVISWIFYTASTISLFRFDNSFNERYASSYDINNTYNITFYKMIAFSNGDEGVKKDIESIGKIISYLDDNKYGFGFFKDTGQAIPISTLKSTIEELNEEFSLANKVGEFIQPIGFSTGMIDNFTSANYSITEEWNKTGPYIPVVLGYNFKGKFEIGDTISNNEETYIVKGFFEKDALFYNYNDVVGSSFLLNSSFIIPLETSEYLDARNLNPIVLFLDDSLNKDTVFNEIYSISNRVEVESLKDNLSGFLEEIDKKKLYETIRVLIIALMSTTSILITISYKLYTDRERIGILYSVGADKKRIYGIFSFEFMINVIIGLIIGSIFYQKNCYKLIYVFVNEYFMMNLYIAIVILLLIILLTLFIGFRQLNKLNPKDMIQGRDI